MGEYLNKNEYFGILIQAKSAQSNDPPVSAGSGSDHWDNYASIQPFWLINGIPGTISFHPNTNVEELNYNASESIYMEQKRTLINNAGSLPTTDFEMYGTPTATAVMVVLALQQFSQGITPHWSKTILPADPVLDMRGNNEGYLASAIEFTADGGGNVIQNSIINNLTLTFLNNGQGEARLLRCTGQLMGAKSLTGLSYTTSNFTAPESYTFNEGNVPNDAFKLNFSMNGTSLTDFCWRQLTITINNNVFSDCLSENEPNNLKRSTPEITCQLDIPKNDDTIDLIDKFKKGEVVQFDLENGYSSTAVNYFKFFCEVGYVSDNPKASEGEYQAWSIPISVRRPTTGWSTMFTINDGVEWNSLP